MRLPLHRSDRPTKHPAPSKGFDPVEASRMITLLDGYLVNHFDDFTVGLIITLVEQYRTAKKGIPVREIFAAIPPE